MVTGDTINHPGNATEDHQTILECLILDTVRNVVFCWKRGFRHLVLDNLNSRKKPLTADFSNPRQVIKGLMELLE